MKISRLILKDFRSYSYGNFQFSDTTNVLIGKNAQGKTNLIEAIYLLSVAKSFRTRINQEMIAFNQPYAKILGQISTKTMNKKLEMVLFEKGKQARVNDGLCHKTSEFVGIFNVVVFTPDDLFFVKGSPKIRRRFMDIELSKISSVYLSYFNPYQHYLKERNQYFKQSILKNKKDDLYLEVVTDQLIDAQIEIAKRRQDFIIKLNHLAGQVYSRIAGNEERLKITYATFFNGEDPECKEKLKKLYQEVREKEYRYAKTQLGVHKDDITVLLNDRPASLFASQGQQRSIVLALKIGLLQLIYQEIGEYPVLLLDDVLSELDFQRQNLLLNLVSDDIQTFITTTSIDGLQHEVIKKAKKIEIQKGRS